jgi:hypothetical protein
MMVQVFDAKLEPREKLVLLVLANFANDAGDNVWPSVATVARMTGLSDSSVQRSIKKMLADGYLASAGEVSVLTGKVNRYSIIAGKIPTGISVTPVSACYPTGISVTPHRYQPATQSVNEPSNEPLEEKDDGAGAPIITPVPAGADVANATASTDFDAQARAAGIHNQSAPPRKPRKSPANLTLDTADDERVKAYLRILCQHEITQTNAGLICQRVSDLGLWVAALERWAQGDGSVSYRPTNFSGLFENYDRRVTAASTPKPAQSNGRQPLTEPAGFAILRQMTGGNNGK